MNKLKIFQALHFILIPIIITGCQNDLKNIERPEKIVSKRQVVYDNETYSKLADLWKTYNEKVPSEDSYANWMYAARYAEWPDYEPLLKTGLDKYPANPTLLYLTAILNHGKKEDLESIHLLERAVSLDPSFLDPWFGLAVDYMGMSEMEKSDAALRKLLQGNAINEEVMDYNYNVIAPLDKNAILITNGDNDTYPGWMLTRLLNYRPDIKIVNRSLLNTEWYPQHIIKNDGIPNFITQKDLTKLRKEILDEIKDGKKLAPQTGPFSDTLITRLIDSAIESKRPVYLAATLYRSRVIKKYIEDGTNFGLVTRIGRTNKNYSNDIKKLVNIWLNEFRTGGLNSWHLKYGKDTAAGKWLAVNYGFALKSLMGPILKYVPEKRLDLFKWYKNFILNLLPSENVDVLNSAWCSSNETEEINDWCKMNNYLE